MYREGILVCLKENIFWSVPENTGSMAGHEPVRECGLLAINDTCVIKWFGSFGHNEWCFIVIICWANIHSYPRTCRNTCPAKKTVLWFAWKRTDFCWCLKLQEAWRAGHEPVRECGLAINDTALLNGFGHNEWCFIVNTSWLTCLHGPVDWAAYKYFISSVKIRSLRGVRLKTQVRSSIKIHP